MLILCLILEGKKIVDRFYECQYLLLRRINSNNHRILTENNDDDNTLEALYVAKHTLPYFIPVATIAQNLLNSNLDVKKKAK